MCSGSGLPRPQGIVWPWTRATILPWSGRPRDCLGSSVCRYITRHDKPHDCWYFWTNNKPNDNAKDFRNNCWNDFSNFSRFNSANSLLLRSRYRSLFGCGHACSCKRVHDSGHSCQYFLANFSGYFAAYTKEKNERGIKPSRGWSWLKLQAIRTDVFNVPAPVAP